MTQVVGAALVDDLDAPTRVLAARRGPGGRHAGGWELPGGKVEPGEHPDDALVRELDEELAVRVVPGPLVAGPLDGDWPLPGVGTLRVRLAVVDGVVPAAGPDHDELRWVDLAADPVGAVAWLPADVPVVAALRRRLTTTRLLVLPERAAAQDVAAALGPLGVEVGVHRELLAGDDDLEDAQWVVALEPGPAALAVPDDLLDRLASEHEGWLEQH